MYPSYMPTFVQYLADLRTIVTGLRYPIPARDAAAPLLHLVHELTRPRTPPDNPRGVVIYVPRVPFTASTWLVVSSQVLVDLNYPNIDAWRTAAALANFIHADDLDEVTTHTNPVAPSPAIYDPRILRGNDSGYREMRVQGLNFDLQPLGVTDAARVALLWRP